MADLITAELGAGPAEHLAAGASPDVFSADTAARTGADVFKPTPAIIGEIFGGSRVDLGADESLDVAAGWRPDLIITETFDAVGPMVAAAQGIPWHHAGIGPALPAAIADAIAETAAARYAQRGLTHIRPASYFDPCPPTLQTLLDAPRAPYRGATTGAPHTRRCRPRPAARPPRAAACTRYLRHDFFQTRILGRGRCRAHGSRAHDHRFALGRAYCRRVALRTRTRLRSRKRSLG
jgi:hypothetical protein